MPSVLVVCYDTSTGRYLVQKAGSAQIADESITSAQLASGAVIGDRIAVAGIFSGYLASGSVGPAAILGNGIIISAKIGANIIATPHIQNQGILSASIGTGEIGDTLLADFGIISGKVASGAITEQNLASGISIDIAEIGQEPTYRAGGLVSAYLGVQFSTSGYFNYAQPGDINTMPAVGLTATNILSGQVGTFQHTGRMGNAAWDFSGHVGELLFLGTSSQVTLTAPSASGQCVQRLSKVINEDTVFLKPELYFVQLAE